MYQSICHIGCFILKAKGQCYLVDSFRLDLSISSIPRVTISIKNSSNIAVQYNQGLPTFDTAEKLYADVINAQEDRKMLEIELVQHKKNGEEVCWFKGLLATIQTAVSSSIQQHSVLDVSCICLHPICQLYYNYVTQSIYTTPQYPISIDVANKIYKIYQAGFKNSQAFSIQQQSLESIISSKGVKLKQDSILQIVNKALQALFQVRNNRYKDLKALAIDLRNFNLNKYFQSSLYVNQKVYTNGGDSAEQRYLKQLYSFIANNVSNAPLAQALLNIFSTQQFLQVVPSGKKQESNKLKIKANNIQTYKQSQTNIIKPSDMKSCNIVYSAVGNLKTPEALIVVFNPHTQWTTKQVEDGSKQNKSIDNFGIYPRSLRSSSGGKQRRIKFLQGPAWIDDISTVIEKSQGKKDKGGPPRATCVTKKSLPEVKDIFAQQLFFSNFLQLGTASIQLIPNQRFLYDIDSRLGQTFQFQYEDKKGSQSYYYGVLSSLTYTYSSSAQKTRLIISANMQNVVQTQSVYAKQIYLRQRDLTLYQEKK